MKKVLFLAFVALFLANCATREASVFKTQIQRPGVIVSTNDAQIASEVANNEHNYATMDPAIAEALKKNPQAYVSIDVNGVTYMGNTSGGAYMRGVWENYSSGPIEVTIYRAGEKQYSLRFMVPPNNYTRLSLLPGNYQSTTRLADGRTLSSQWSLDAISGNQYSTLAKETVDFFRYTR